MVAPLLPIPTPGPPDPPRALLSDALAWLRRSWAANPPLALVGLGTLALAIPLVVGVFADPRVITGAPAWL